MPDLLHFEDFHAGQKFDLGTHTLTAEEIIAFASEFDPQPMHTDPEAAKRGLLGGLAASGWHLCALVMRMTVDNLFSRVASLGAPGVDEVQWRRPARPGDVLHLAAEVLETRASASKPTLGFVRFRFSLMRGDERVMFFETAAMFGRRSV
jgi:acyl dehydratase